MRRYTPKTKPFRHQAVASIKAAKRRNLAFLMDPGTGKTKVAIDAACMLHLAGKLDKVVVACPIAAMPVWADEVATHAPVKLDWRIINYDKLSQRTRRRSRYVYRHIARVENFRPDLLILDESHRCASASSNRSQALWRLVTRLRKTNDEGKPWVWLLTGTPKEYIHVFSQYRIMDPSIFGTSKAGFEEEYCVYGKGARKWTIIKYRNKRQLLKKIRDHSVTAPELDLPPQLFQPVKVTLPPKARKIYDTMAADMLVQLEGDEELTAKNTAVKRLRLRQITGGFTTSGSVIHGAKLAAAQDILYDLFEQRQHVVVYAHFLAEVESLKGLCRRLGFETFAISGGVGQATRGVVVRRFQKTDPGTKPMALVFQVETGSLSITLTNAHEVLFYSLPDGWDTWHQAVKRTHRIGQGRSVRYRLLLCPGTVDMSMVRALQRKASMHHTMMRTPNRFLLGKYTWDEVRRGFDTMNVSKQEAKGRD